VAASESSRIVISGNKGIDWQTVASPIKKWIGLEFRPDGGRLIAAAQGDGIYIWEPRVGEIAAFPGMQTGVAGGTASFRAASLSLSPVAYQWQHGGTNLPGQTSSTLTLTNLQFSDGGNYAVWATNDLGAVLSSNAVLNVVPALITKHPTPSSLTVLAGEDATYSVAAVSSVPVEYRWYRDGTWLPDFSGSEIVLTNIFPGQAGTYTCEASNIYGAVRSSGASLFVLPSRVVTLTPDTTPYTARLDASFQRSMLSWGWFEGGLGTNLDFSTPPQALSPDPTATNFTAIISGLRPYGSYQVRAVVSNAAGVVYGSTIGFTPSPRLVRADAPATNWTALALTADATRMAAIGGGRVYVSTNSGGQWYPTTKAGRIVLTSTNGNRLLVLEERSLFVSTNFGTSWSTIAMPTRFDSMVASGDGMKLFSVYGGLLCTSTNGGARWLQLDSVGVHPFSQLASSYDGNTLSCFYYSYSSPCFVFISTNFGKAWSMLYGGMANVSAMSRDGKTILIFGYAGTMTKYTNGVSAAVSPGLGREASYAVSSGDGERWALLAGILMLSRDGALSWFPANVPPGKSWNSVANSDDGNVTVALATDGLYISRYHPSARLSAQVASGKMRLSWPGPSSQFVLQESSDLSAWSDASNSPVLNLTNLDFEISLPFAPGSHFYRLAVP
jgi:hypothetical protein